MTLHRHPTRDRFSAPAGDDPLELSRGAAAPQTMVDDLPLPRARSLRKYKKPATYSIITLALAGVGLWVVGRAGVDSARQTVPFLRTVETSLNQPKLPSYAPAGPSEDTVLIQFKLVPARARVFVDGKLLESNPMRMPRGQRIVRVEAIEPGHESATVDVLPSENRTVTIKLRRSSPGKRPRQR